MCVCVCLDRDVVCYLEVQMTALQEQFSKKVLHLLAEEHDEVCTCVCVCVCVSVVCFDFFAFAGGGPG